LAISPNGLGSKKSKGAPTMSEPDVEALQGALGDLAHAVEQLADAIKEGPFSDSATRLVAVDVSKTARNIARQFAEQSSILADRAGEESPGPAGVAAVSLPEDVVALARAGKTLDAVKRYREITGATLDEAKAVIGDIT
jgi:ribosomal protein L7/L12